MKFLIINGPNLNLLGQREPGIYGEENYESLCAMIRAYAEENGAEADFFQSNHEGGIIDVIHAAQGVYDAIIINPGAYTHTSIALLDAVKAVNIPTVEVHISDPDSREEFRRISYIREACIATIKGHGLPGYPEALRLLCSR